MTAGLLPLPMIRRVRCPTFESEVLDVRRARLAGTQAIQPEEYRKHGVVVIESFGGEQERAEFGAVQAASLARMDARTAHVLGGVRRDAAVDVGVPVEATHCREAPVDGRGREPALLEGNAVQPDVRAGRAEYSQSDVGGPLEVRAQIVAVGVEGTVAIAGQERSRGQLGFIERVGRFEPQQRSAATGQAQSWVLLGQGRTNTTSWAQGAALPSVAGSQTEQASVDRERPGAGDR